MNLVRFLGWSLSRSMDEDKPHLEVVRHDGRLLLKIKKGGDGDGALSIAEKDPQDQPIAMSYSCEHCGKEFESRKALGGHVRIHKDGLAVKKGWVKAAPDGNAEEDQGATCDICGKEFSSPRSLYGHMRSHPEREWRGMQPPGSASHESQSSQTSTELDAVKASDHIDCSNTAVTGPVPEPALVDLSKTKFLLSWSMTGKRGRKSSIISSGSLGQGYSCSKPEDWSQEEQEAAKILHSLANAPISSSQANPPIKPSPHEDFLGSGPAPRSSMEPCTDNGNAGHADTGKQKKRNKKRNFSELETAEVNEKRIDHDDDPATSSPEKYRCNICDKSFLTYQALGGHKSVHKRAKNTHSQSEQLQDHHPAPKPSSQHDNEMDRSDSSDSHECEICKKRFQTGQALGGHKRLHYTGSPEAKATSSDEASGTGQRKKPFDFDLNGPPPAEAEEEEEGVLGLGSSTH
ncbi:zinc finger protein ZAT9-like [Punica granatum]|uniref:C2H2-type domain-containing protein n=2 Tax=Punica granatum TaxID=22663 RepID=A0A218X9D1_PUNGR|nr:zinc finger protein ZAT9-like [Punica granatum]OWM81121.1 hypothetical protein CDL15_Pgr007152 [Punica granatum]PKI54704.1 hypothetical protein CRG98_024904 [Punica granatum]